MLETARWPGSHRTAWPAGVLAHQAPQLVRASPRAQPPDVQVEEVRQLIALLGLDRGGGFALRLRSLGDLASVPQEHRGTMQSVWDRMGRLCLATGLLCTQVLRMQGPDIESLISATYDR